MDMQLSGGDRSSKVVYVAVALALIGLIAGVVGAARGVAAGRALGGLETRLAEIEQKAVASADSAGQVSEQMRKFVTEANAIFENFGRSIRTLQTDVKRHEEKLAPTATAGSSTQTRTAAAGGGAAETVATASGKTHEVKPGETMERIARAQGIKLADLMQLNPQVDPFRMKVGTKLNLP